MRVGGQGLRSSSFPHQVNEMQSVKLQDLSALADSFQLRSAEGVSEWHNFDIFAGDNVVD